MLGRRHLPVLIMKKIWWIITAVILIVAGWVFLERRLSDAPPPGESASYINQ